VFGSRCVVILLMAFPPSDWFWCGQLPLHPVHSLQRLKRVSARSQRLCFTPLLPSFGPPYSVALIRVFSFLAGPLVCASHPCRVLSSRSLPRGGVLTMPGLTITAAHHPCALGLAAVAISALPASSIPAPLAVVFLFIHTCQTFAGSISLTLVFITGGDGRLCAP